MNNSVDTRSTSSLNQGLFAGNTFSLAHSCSLKLPFLVMVQPIPAKLCDALVYNHHCTNMSRAEQDAYINPRLVSHRPDSKAKDSIYSSAFNPIYDMPRDKHELSRNSLNMDDPPRYAPRALECLNPENRVIDMAETADQHMVAAYLDGHVRYSLQYSKPKSLSYNKIVTLLDHATGERLGETKFEDNLLSKNDVPVSYGSAGLGTRQTTLQREGKFSSRHKFQYSCPETNQTLTFAWNKSKQAKGGWDLQGPNNDTCALFTPVVGSERGGRLELFPSIGQDLERVVILTCVGMMAKKARDDGESKLFEGLFDF